MAAKLDRWSFTKARKRANWTQRELGEALGHGHNYISRIERGEREITLADYLKACKIMGIKVEECLTD